MYTEKFAGSGLDQLETCFAELAAHRGHLLLFALVNLSNAAIQCSTCSHRVLDGSRELIEAVYLEWSMQEVNR
jgi:hypothetical protein